MSSQSGKEAQLILLFWLTPISPENGAQFLQEQYHIKCLVAEAPQEVQSTSVVFISVFENVMINLENTETKTGVKIKRNIETGSLVLTPAEARPVIFD